MSKHSTAGRHGAPQPPAWRRFLQWWTEERFQLALIYLVVGMGAVGIGLISLRLLSEVAEVLRTVR